MRKAIDKTAKRSRLRRRAIVAVICNACAGLPVAAQNPYVSASRLSVDPNIKAVQTVGTIRTNPFCETVSGSALKLASNDETSIYKLKPIGAAIGLQSVEETPSAPNREATAMMIAPIEPPAIRLNPLVRSLHHANPDLVDTRLVERATIRMASSPQSSFPGSNLGASSTLYLVPPEHEVTAQHAVAETPQLMFGTPRTLIQPRVEAEEPLPSLSISDKGADDPVFFTLSDELGFLDKAPTPHPVPTEVPLASEAPLILDQPASDDGPLLFDQPLAHDVPLVVDTPAKLDAPAKPDAPAKLNAPAALDAPAKLDAPVRLKNTIAVDQVLADRPATESSDPTPMMANESATPAESASVDSDDPLAWRPGGDARVLAMPPVATVPDAEPSEPDDVDMAPASDPVALVDHPLTDPPRATTAAEPDTKDLDGLVTVEVESNELGMPAFGTLDPVTMDSDRPSVIELALSDELPSKRPEAKAAAPAETDVSDGIDMAIAPYLDLLPQDVDVEMPNPQYVGTEDLGSGAILAPPVRFDSGLQEEVAAVEGEAAKEDNEPDDAVLWDQLPAPSILTSQSPASDEPRSVLEAPVADKAPSVLATQPIEVTPSVLASSEPTIEAVEMDPAEAAQVVKQGPSVLAAVPQTELHQPQAADPPRIRLQPLNRTQPRTQTQPRNQLQPLAELPPPRSAPPQPAKELPSKLAAPSKPNHKDQSALVSRTPARQQRHDAALIVRPKAPTGLRPLDELHEPVEATPIAVYRGTPAVSGPVPTPEQSMHARRYRPPVAVKPLPLALETNQLASEDSTRSTIEQVQSMNLDGVKLAPQDTVAATPLNMSRGQVRSLTVGGKVTRVEIADDSVCQAIATSPSQLKLIGTRNGVTRLTIWAQPNEPGAETLRRTFEVRVDQAVEATGQTVAARIKLLNQSIGSAFPNCRVAVRPYRDQLVVVGQCDSEATARRIIRMVRKTVLVPVRDQLQVQ